MPSYRCEIITPEGKPVLVLKTAESPEALRREIEATGGIFCGATPIDQLLGKSLLSLERLIVFTRKLHAYTRAHLPLAQALALFQREPDSPEALISQVLQHHILEGVPLYQAMATFPEVFSALYRSSVRIGEESGELPYFLEGVIEHLTTMKTLRAELTSAMVYPSILAVVALLTVLGLAWTTVPIFEAAIRDLGKAPPFLTVLVVQAITLGMTALPYLATGGFLIWWWGIPRLRSSQTVRRAIDRFLLTVPVISGVILRFHRSVFSKTMALLLRRGIHLVESLHITTDATDNSHVKECLVRGIQRMKESGGLQVFFREVPVLGGLTEELALAGEETGALAEMFGIAFEYESEELRGAIRRLLSLVEPALILCTGILVGTMLLAMFLPIFKVAESM